MNIRQKDFKEYAWVQDIIIRWNTWLHIPVYLVWFGFMAYRLLQVI